MPRKTRKRYQLSILTVIMVAATVIFLTATNALAQLADSPWPMVRHDLQNTGRSPYLGVQEPELKWTLKTPDGAGYSSPVIGYNGTIYVGGGDKIYNFYAIKPDGTLKWMYVTGSSMWYKNSAAIASDGTIYIGTYDGNLHAINPDGTLKWKYQVASLISYSYPVIGSDGTIYISTSETLYYGYLHAINPDGTIKWTCLLPNYAFPSQPLEFFGSPAIGSDGTIYVGSSYCLFAISPFGTLKWKYTSDIVEPWGSPAIGFDGTIYVVNQIRGYLHAINPDGTMKWKYGTGLWYSLRKSPAIASDGTIYVRTSSDGNLHAINPDGTLKWVCYTGASSPDLPGYPSPVIGSDGTIYVVAPFTGSLDAIHLDGLYAINPDGTMKWRFYTGKTVFHESPAIGSDGTIYLQSGSYTFAIGPLLTPPVAVAEPGIDVNGNLILDGSNSCDSDGTIISWNWALTNRDPAGNNFTLTGKTALIEGVDIGIYDVTLTVTDDDGLTGTNTAVLYVPAGVGVGVCPELQALLDNTKAALGITDEDQIVPAIIDLQNQVSTLTQQNADLTEENTKLKDEITELQNKIDQINNTLTVGLGSIETDFQSVFNDPDFIIPGDTLLEKFQALNQAVLDLNKGRKEGIYVNLGGKPGKGK